MTGPVTLVHELAEPMTLWHGCFTAELPSGERVTVTATLPPVGALRINGLGQVIGRELQDAVAGAVRRRIHELAGRRA